jgi:hypothetical protein
MFALFDVLGVGIAVVGVGVGVGVGVVDVSVPAPDPAEEGAGVELTPPPPPQAASARKGMMLTHVRALANWIRIRNSTNTHSTMSTSGELPESVEHIVKHDVYIW